MRKLILAFLCVVLLAFVSQVYSQEDMGIKVGADSVEEMIERCGTLKVAVVTNANATLSVGSMPHLVDTLQSRGVNIVKVFTPEHGFYVTADAGQVVRNQGYIGAEIPVVSLYGKRKKPSGQELRGVELLIFDLPDVGCRFYTYLSTLYYVLEACAAAHIPVLLLDRPNPCDNIDGPVIKEEKFKSFVGILPIPVLHALTLGEVARMMVGEKWIAGDPLLNLHVIPCQGWKHGQPYSLPKPPSPNLKSARAIALYPTLCFLEGTSWSVGRGTETPFEQVGYPNKKMGEVCFTPNSRAGAMNPLHKGRVCYGPPLSSLSGNKIHLEFLVQLYRLSNKYGVRFFTRSSYFDLLAGTSALRKQITAGYTAAQIRENWIPDLITYKKKRNAYLLYPDTRLYWWEKEQDLASPSLNNLGAAEAK